MNKLTKKHCVYTVEYCSSLKKKQILPSATTWINWEEIMQSKIRQTQKDCTISLTCGIYNSQTYRSREKNAGGQGRWAGENNIGQKGTKFQPCKMSKF